MKQLAAMLAVLMLAFHPLLMGLPAQAATTETVTICGEHGAEQITIASPGQAPVQMPDSCGWCCLCCPFAVLPIADSGPVETIWTARADVVIPRALDIRTRSPRARPGSPRGPPILS